MMTTLQKATVLAGALLTIGATCNLATAAPLDAQSGNSEASSGFSPATLDAIKAHAAKASAIAQQIRAASPMDDSNYLSLNQALLGASDAGLAAASTAMSYREAMKALRRAADEKAIGDLSRDFVFYPIVPCRVLDTRANGVMITGGVPFGVDFDGGNPGNAAGCTYGGISGQIGGALGPPILRSALMINLTVTEPTAPGFMQARPVGSTNVTSNINYVAGQTIANMAVVQNSNIGWNDLELFSQVSTHAIIDAMGLFAPPAATAVDQNVLFTTTNVPASTTFEIFSPACPAGWRATGGGHVADSFNSPATLTGSRPVATGNIGLVTGVNVATQWLCQGTNTAIAQNYRCFVVCSRVPGR